MTHNYKHKDMSEEDRNALTPVVRREFFADYTDPVFDGPPRKQKRISVPNNLKLNTEGDE